MIHSKERTMKGWTDIGCDVNWEDYGGKWGKVAKDGSVFIIRFENGHEHDPELPKYMCDVQRVDLENLPAKEVANALRSYGWRVDGEDIISDQGDVVGSRNNPLLLAEVCSSYGLYEPLDSFSSETYARRLRAQARRSAEAFMRDADCLEAALERPVNKLGSTAREYGRGDINSALFRGVGPEADLMRKLHGMP